ncbi:phosphoribosyl-AMP cyclohydrolase [Litoreibacter roseus]|uniref:Phosphoribosyl-AMP cyclohydrolase n=1 Tax=Litoreibacter roseus TaxID=2601869 RepID=A0A6N6JBF5_9RHOB|nr:phosphoribosyl-AMP cyclohydrolase [Litoreibacter roseus]GFE63190.1 hypothetical protein KIN_02640 [Litoreibacter roseus]
MLKTFTTTAALAIFASTGIAAASDDPTLTPDRVTEFKTAWGEGIVNIGAVHTAGGDYQAAARDHILNFYAFGKDIVLFKPTLASDDQFRGTFDEALSYFVGGSISEDKGFAIAPYTAVRWENEGTTINGDIALAMGNYYFTTTDGAEVKVEYTFGIEQMDDEELKIILHHSSLPFTPS